MPIGRPRADLTAVPTTLHSRIAAGVREQIASGDWPPHFRLKPEPELAAELGVSRGTLRRALSTLIAEGALVRVRGKGTFVTSTVLEPALAQKLSTLSEDFAALGIALRTRVIESSLREAPAPVAALLAGPAGEPVLRLRRVRGTADGPVALLDNFVRADLAPGIEAVDFATDTLFGTLASRYELLITGGRRTFTATAADAEQAELLDIPEGTPLLHLEQITYLSTGEPVEYSDVWIRSDRLRVTSLLSR